MALVEDIKDLEFKSVEELYILLGEQLLSEALGIDEFSDEERKDEARSWEEQHKKSLRDSICSSRLYKAYVENPEGWDWVEIVTELANQIVAVVVGISPLTVAALLLKKGLKKLCAKDEQ